MDEKDAKSDQNQPHYALYLIENNGEPGGARTRDHRIKRKVFLKARPPARGKDRQKSEGMSGKEPPRATLDRRFRSIHR